MNFEDFKNRVLLVLRKKDDEEFSFHDEVLHFFKLNDYAVKELTVMEDFSFRAKVYKRDWTSESQLKLPFIDRDVVGRKIGKEIVLLVDEAINDKKYYYFEIYDKNNNLKNKLWLGDFLSNLDDSYMVSILRAFEDDLSPHFAWKVDQEAKVLKKKIFYSDKS